MEELVYPIYFIGLFSSDCNALLLIIKQLYHNFATVISRWNGAVNEVGEDDDPSSLYILHATAYIAYLIFTAVLLYFTIFPSELRTCKRNRMFLMSEHVLFSGVCDVFLALSRQRGNDVIPDLMISRLPTVINNLVHESRFGEILGSLVLEWSPTLPMVFALMKIVLWLMVSYAVSDSLVCSHCKDNEGCKASFTPPCPVHSHSHTSPHSHSHSHSHLHECIELKSIQPSKHLSSIKRPIHLRNSKKHR